ncbi:E3 ubiquitin-protein ligase TRIM47-like [Silurus meridionalis]|uniref:E3 ubiquitin-protein ligase TRIM47-like n=1 Tax=Silurus meridionalis TaxID=175797 RepID=UPI001EEA8AD2|nr:E3 ubiquitin-protein ligase TRIM47-like [Silurus meridionalis]
MDEEIDTSPDVACYACTGRKRKAEQSCLQSLASYCVDHLDMHNVLHLNAKRHKLVGATGRFEERLCPEHDKLMELELGSIKKDINDRIKTRQRETKELKQATEAFQTSARQAVEDNENSFTELIHSIETRQREVKELILAREKAAVEKAKEFLERLPSEICDLKRGIVNSSSLKGSFRQTTASIFYNAFCPLQHLLHPCPPLFSSSVHTLRLISPLKPSWTS